MDNESKFLGVSIRGWLAVFIVSTVCFMSVRQIAVIEPLYSMAMLALGFYFGQKSGNKEQAK
jgi:5-bromo-4-chloroindolyl phosphate hydrolysis protein